MITTSATRRAESGPRIAAITTARLRRRRRRRWPLIMIAVMVLVLAGAGVWLVGFSPILTTQRVEVRGATITDPQAVLDAAAVPIGRPLARLDIDVVAERVAGLAGIESVAVTRSYPSTVLITVHERTALLAVTDGDGFLLLDRFGVPFRRVPTRPAEAMLAEFNAGNAALAEQLGRVAQALPTEIRADVTRVTATSESAIQLRLTGGARVVWGTADDSDRKAEVLVALLKIKGKVYDVSAPTNPAIR